MARYRRHRTDFHAHEKTAALSSLARDLMWYAVERGGLLGVIEQSTRRLAATIGHIAPGVACTGQHVTQALRELAAAGVAIWWEDLETLWVINCADEQAKGSKAWKGCESQVRELPREVASAIAKRYPNLSDRSGIEGESSPHTVPVPVTDPVKLATPEDLAEAAAKAATPSVWTQLRSLLAAEGPPADAKRWSVNPPKGFADLLADNTASEILDGLIERRGKLGESKWTWSHVAVRPEVWRRTHNEMADSGDTGDDW